jgi:hypothetical protein
MLYKTAGSRGPNLMTYDSLAMRGGVALDQRSIGIISDKSRRVRFGEHSFSCGES